MNINDLIAIVKKKLQNQIALESILVEDKSFLHKNHVGNQAGTVSYTHLTLPTKA